jgi:hypothetical protein
MRPLLSLLLLATALTGACGGRLLSVASKSEGSRIGMFAGRVASEGIVAG